MLQSHALAVGEHKVQSDAENINEYMNTMSCILGYIDSVISENPGFRVCILGDLNFECVSSYPGFALFSQFCTSYDLISCDDLVPSESYTYCHLSLDQKTFLDHVFIPNDLKSHVHEFCIIDDGVNPSDHFPLSFHFAISMSNVTVDHSHITACVREYRWDKGDRSLYYSKSGELLGCINHKFECESVDKACCIHDHQIDIDIYYNELVHALTVAADFSIPKVPRSALKHYWSVALDDLKQSSKDAYDLWVLYGRPRNGIIFDLMKDAKYKYKLAIRDAVRCYEYKFSDELYEHLLSKNMSDFWRTWSARTCRKVVAVNNVGGATTDYDIAEKFKQKFMLNQEPHVDVNTYEYCNGDELMYESDLIMLSTEDVDKAVRSIKRGKAAGADNLTAEHILYSHPSIVIHLRRLFNLILKHSYVPVQFGNGIIIPLVKDHNGDVCNVDNYRGITLSPVVSKIFESCLLSKCECYLYSNELQFGFKKQMGCGPPIFTFQQVVSYFTRRDSQVYMTAVDASKAFDRLSHKILMNKLHARKLPLCFINVIKNWYGKLRSAVRWNGIFSTVFSVTCGVRQGGILSPILFNLYVDELIDSLRNSGNGCFVNTTFVGCIMYADDLLLLSPSLRGMQAMLDICTRFGTSHDIVFNVKKTLWSCTGNVMPSGNFLYLSNETVPYVNSFKYPSINFLVKRSLTNDVPFIKRKFYAACNSMLMRSKTTCKILQVQQAKSFCLSLLTYSVGALDISRSKVRELAVCWNDAFRKKINLNRLKS